MIVNIAGAQFPTSLWCFLGVTAVDCSCIKVSKCGSFPACLSPSLVPSSLAYAPPALAFFLFPFVFEVDDGYCCFTLVCLTVIVLLCYSLVSQQLFHVRTEE